MAISPLETIAMSQAPRARLVYRDYWIDFEQEEQGWRVVAIKHSVNQSSLLPPAFLYPDQAKAERYARAAIDVQISPRRR
jgi:hypothetical protein